MKHLLILISTILCVGLMLNLSSCTDVVGDDLVNAKQGGSTTTVADIETATGMLYEAMYRLHDSREHQYQFQSNLHIDNYAGYLCVANSLEGRLPSTYAINSQFESGPTDNLSWIARSVVPVMNSAETLGAPELGAIASIMFNFAASEYVDIYGPMPYHAYRNLQEDPPVLYDKVSDVYKTILQELKTAQKTLANLKVEIQDDEVRREQIKGFDRICKGEVSNWIYFANTLRLRLAMRMVKVEPELAKAEAEAAIKDGVLNTNQRPNIELDLGGGRHPLYVISVLWNDSRLNASFEVLLKRLNNPLLKVWFSGTGRGVKNKAGEVVIPEEGDPLYIGIRSGTSVDSKAVTLQTYVTYSAVSQASFSSRNVSIMKASEAMFLCAEAKLRGWTAGNLSALEYYEMGVKRYFSDEGKPETEANTYLALITPVDSIYRDPLNPNNNYSDRSNMIQVGNRWDAGGLTTEQHLEQIITQKYIANFPMGLNSWSEFRRTGYPKLIPVVYDAGDGSIDTGGYIRRIKFKRGGATVKDDIVNSAIPALKAEDSSGINEDVQGARLWWDRKDKGNF